MKKICTKCKKTKTSDLFRKHKRQKDGRYCICKACERLAWWSLRKEVYSHYGGYVCAVCGETDPETLQIDHILNNGKAHRAEINQDARHIIVWLKKHNYPDGFQVLCKWCNLIKALTLNIKYGSGEWERKIKSINFFLKAT